MATDARAYPDAGNSAADSTGPVIMEEITVHAATRDDWRRRRIIIGHLAGTTLVPMSYFDSREPFPRPDVADLDRVYRFAWHGFTQEHWDKLDAIYKKLPGWIGYDPVPWWFGKDESKSPHLTASVEPPGLQVSGVLSVGLLTSWHNAFMDAIRDFPAGEPN